MSKDTGIRAWGLGCDSEHVYEHCAVLPPAQAWRESRADQQRMLRSALAGSRMLARVSRRRWLHAFDAWVRPACSTFPRPLHGPQPARYKSQPPSSA